MIAISNSINAMKCSNVKMTNKIRKDVMANAWYIYGRRGYGVQTFAQALAKAWWNLKYKILCLRCDGLDPNVVLNQVAPRYSSTLVAVPDDYYGKRNTYYGD